MNEICLSCKKHTKCGRAIHETIGCGYYAPLTEQEYIQTCNTEQLVHVIHLMTTSCFVCGKDGVDYKRCYFHKKCTGPKEIEEWLKEPHNSFE